MKSLHPDSVLYQDNHLLVLNKPAGTVTQGADDQQPSLLRQAQLYLKQKYNKPGNVYLGIVSRLDKPVTGVIVMARTSKAAARLSNQFRLREVSKTYHALIPLNDLPAELQLVDYIRKNDQQHRMEICRKNDPQAKQAIMTVKPLQVFSGLMQIQIKMETGRKHQIRLQLSTRGFPIAGDRKYDSDVAFQPGIALHSKTLALEHPVKKQWLEFDSPLPQSWNVWM